MADDSVVSSSSENSFDLQTLLEPWPDENPRVPITRNVSQESSFQQRIRTFGNADEESPFLMGKNPIDFLKGVKENLSKASTQEEYNGILDFENTDLQVREIRKDCFFLFLRTLGSPPLENSNSKEAILSFLESEREALEAELKDSGIHPTPALWISWTEDSFGINVLLEPEPSSATALANYRAQNADAEAQLFSLIRSLESQLSYGLPPQLNNGDYAQLIRDDFETAFNVNHYRGAIARELHEVQIMLLKSRLQDLLSDHMISEPSLESILQRSPYKNIRKEAYDFIEDQVQSISSMRYPFQRNILEGSLNQFIRDIEQNGTRAPIYREFYSYFTDEEFRRRLGL
ncbi:hypothetical protein Q3G72_027992 [Acer saccharum]|nr:hypothetical protein Q3G72_027992 [Acer saccharum]